MKRVTWVRGGVAVLAVLLCVPAFGIAYTSNQTGDWSSSATWTPAGVPGLGDTVSITGSHIVTVSDARSVTSVTLLNNSGGKVLHAGAGGNLTITGTGAPLLVNPSSDGINLVQLDGGTITVSNANADVNVIGGGLTLARIQFTSLGGTLAIGRHLTFAGNSINAQLQFDAGSNGLLQLGGDLGENGNISTLLSNGTIEFNGTAGQSIGGGYTLQNLTIDKTGTATLNNTTLINGDLTIVNGVLDDGGYQIGLNLLNTSSVTIASNGVLKLGSEFTATSFPTPVSPANVTLAANSAVDYQASVPQSIDTSISYKRLFLQKTGTSVSAFKTISGSLLHVIQELYVDTAVTADFDNDVLDVDGDINGTGTIQLSSTLLPGSVTIGGSWNSGFLTAANGTTVTYDGTAAQNILNATYRNLTVNKPSGTATIAGSGGSVQGALDLTSGIVAIANDFMIDVNATVSRTSGYFTGPLTMGMDGTSARRFHIGTSTSYMPVDANGGSPGTLTIETVNGLQPNLTGINTLDRYWRIAAPSTVTSLTSAQFNYNETDYTNGDESLFRLAKYSGGTWTDYNDANETLDYGLATGAGSYLGDWVIGQRGSTGFAGKVVITSVNSGVDPTVNTPFDVAVKTQHDDGTTANVTLTTTIDILLNAGLGSLTGASASITAGTSSATATGLIYDTGDLNVQLRAMSSAGDLLTDGFSLPFNVLTGTTLTVTSLADSGAGTLRAAITTLNAGGCPAPCTIDFGVNGTGNIVLSTPLPVILNPVTIDGTTGTGAQANTTAFGNPLDTIITVSLDGNNAVAAGLVIQSANSTVKGLGFRRFNVAGAGEAIKIDNVAGCTIAGNYIGTDNGGSTAQPNFFGVVLNGAGATLNEIGGNNPADRNLISGNSSWGVVAANGANDNEIAGNYIGIGASGTSALSNGNGGVTLCSTCPSNSVGTAVIGNVISGHVPGVGVQVDGTMNDVVGNRIGTNASGAGPIPNTTGVAVTGDDNYIGGTVAGDRNQISGNSTNGITLSSSDNEICNNWIGTNAAGTGGLPNGGHGVSLTGTAARNQIGAPAPNRIAFNTQKGVELNTTGIGNTIQSNEIYSNTGIAIDLGTDGPTANDATDTDTGANDLQNFPAISTAVINGANVDVTVSLNSSGGVNANFFVIDVFKADASSPSQAATHLGASGCLAGILTNQLISLPAGAVTVGSKIVAAATAFSDAACSTPSEGTSELSPSTIVTGDVHWIAGSGSWENGANWSTGFVPSSGDNAIIDAAGTYTVTETSGQSVKSITIGNGISGQQTLNIAVGPLTIGSASSITSTGKLDLSSNLQGAGTLTNNGQLNWNAGTINNAAVINATSGIAMTIATAGAKTLSGTTLTNGAASNILWSGGTVNLGLGATIANAGLFETSFDGTLNDSGSAGAFTNSGTFRKSGGTASTLLSNITLNHAGGAIEVQQGALDLAGGTSTAPINISFGKKLMVNSDIYTFAAGTALTGTGKVEVSGAGTLTLTAPVTFPALHMLAGQINGSGDVLAGTGGTISWDGGTFSTGGGKISISGTGTMVVGTAASKSLNRLLETVGATASITWGGGTIDIGTNGFINNAGLFESTSDTTLNNSGAGTATVTNTGTFKKSGGGASTTFTGVELVSSGTLWVASGTVNLANATLSGTVDIDSSRVLLVDSNLVTLNSPSFIDNGLLQVSIGQLTMNGTFTLPNLQFDNGLLDGTGAVTHTGAFLWNGGTIQGSGTSTIGAGGSLTIATAAAKTLDRNLTILGTRTATWTGGVVNMGTNGLITNGGTFDIAGDLTLSKSAGGTPTVTNTGLLRKSAGGLSATFTNVALSNSGTGTIQVQSGILNPATASLGGTVDLDPGTKLVIDSDTVTVAGPTSFIDTGSVELQAGTLMVSSNVTLPNLVFINGVIDGTAILTLGSAATWAGGTMQGSGATEIANLATLSMNGSAKALNARTLRPLVGSTVNWSAGNLSMNSGGTIDNSGLFNVTFNGTIGNAGSAGPFTNNNGGTLRKSATTGSLLLTGINLTNNGITDITLGKIDVSGTYTQGASGSLGTLLGGTIPGTQYGQLVTTATPSLAGALNVTLNGPYQPLAGDDFAVVSWPADAHTGNFSPYNLPALINGRTWSTAFNATGLHLTVNSGNADLSIGKTASSPTVITGAALTYTLAVNNAGPDLATSVQVIDTLPAGHTGITAGGTGWTCGVVTSTVTCTASSLASGAAPSITINANAPATPQSFINTATVTASSPDPAGANNSGTAAVTVNAAQADLALSGTNPTSVATGAAVAFSYSILNNGPQTATGVVFTAPIPASLTFASATPPCTFAAGTVTCNLGTLASAGSAALTINTIASTTGTQSITGSVTATESDPSATNNTKTLTVSVTGSSVAVTNVNDSGAGSLRQALLDAQSAVCSTPCSITFNIVAGPFRIQPLTALPNVASSTTLDGTTQPGYSGTPVVELDGTLLTGAPGTLVLPGTNAKVLGLSITNAPAAGAGILLSGNGNTVQRNSIGTTPGNVAAGNDTGILVQGGGNSIGGTGAGEGNDIANSNTNGIVVTATIANTILGNSIHNNTLLGIDLGNDGPTANDAGDADTGPNNRQNSPTLTFATLDGVGGMTITGNIDSSAAGAGSIQFDFFEADAGGEGQTYIGRACVVGNNFGLGSSFSAPGFIAAGDPIVATATAYSDAACTTVADGTSEFSNVVLTTLCTPPPVTIFAPLSMCAGSTASATSSAATATSYNWAITNGTITSGQGTPGITFTGGATGSVGLTLTVTDAGGCSGFTTSSTTINPTPVVTITGPTATCAGTGVTLDAGGPFASYSWSTGEITQTITVTPSSTQPYSVTVTDGNGCSASDSHTVTVSANPTATITAPAGVCANSTGNAASVAAQAGATYAWTIGNGTFTGSTAGPAVTFTAGPTGNVSLGITVTAGSCTSTGNSTLPISAPPIVTITGPTQVCPNNAFTLDAGPGFSSYAWSTGGTGRTVSVTQSAASQVYSVTVTNATGCAATDTHTVTTSAPDATITAPNTAAEGATGLVATVPSQPGATYTWSILNGTIDSGQGTSAITFDAGNAGSTALSVDVTLGGCLSSGNHSVTVTGTGPTQTDIGITKIAPPSVQAGATLVYTLTVTNYGPNDASLVTITDPLPAGTSLVSINDGTFNCAPSSNTVTCLGSLIVNASKDILITVTAPTQNGPITNTAHADAGLPDPNANNDHASATTNVIAAPVNCATTPPSLLSPADNANANAPVTFSWTPVTGALEYELWIVTSQTTSLAGTTNSTSLSLPLASGAANWYVLARLGGDCASLTSAQRTVNVQPAAGCATHTAPQITSPAANGTVTSPVTFSWTPVPGAIGYRVWIEANGTAAQDLGTTNGAITLTANVPPGTVAAHVDALFSGCPDTRSPNLSFNVPRPDPCAGRANVTPLTPASSAVLQSSLVNFAWTDAHADGYRLWLSVDGAPPELAGTTDDTAMQRTIAFGTVEWWLEVLYDGCGSLESPHAHFTIPHGNECPTTAAQLLAPANGVVLTDAGVTFQWTSVPNAIRYELWLANAGATPTLIGTTTATSLTHTVAPGVLQWFVRAFVDRCPPRDSQTAHFTYAPTGACRDAQAPHLLAPLPNANVVSPVGFSWTARPHATSYDLFTIRGNDAPQLVRSTASTVANVVALQTGNVRWFVRVHFADCAPLDSPERQLEIVSAPQSCAPLVPPRISAPGQISNGAPFLLQWDEIPGATAYQLQIASSSAFTNATLLTTGDTFTTLTRTNQGTAPLAVYARVRALDTRCQPAPSITPYGPVAAIFILPAGGVEGAVPLSGGIVTHLIPLGAELAGQSFVATVKEPWLSVAPSSGVVAAGGTQLAVTADTTTLPAGTSLGTVQITLSSSARGVATNATTFKLPTMTVSKVTPVTPAPKSAPPPDALIIPAVAHASGINAQFQSDVRVTNSSAQLLQYQATFTPTGSQGLADGRQTTFSIEAGHTIALDDVLRGWFGTGGDSITGTLEVRPITDTAASTSSTPLTGLAGLVTFAASRTFNVTANGTFGQYIPAIPFANFIGGATDLAPASVLSLQQIAQSDRYRTNLGIVEASGDAVSLLVKVFGSDGQKLKEFPVNLAGGEHTQLNSFLTTNGVGTLSDGRVEISVTGGTGKVTAYASVLDNATSDPLLVTPVTLTDTGNTKWVVPGVADLDNGTANWQTDMRLFNAGTAAVDTTLTFYSQNGGAPRVANITIPAGQVRQFDKALATVFGTTNDGGAIHVSTATPARLVATARTYNQTPTGTYGQFISGVTPAEATGLGDRALQILQVEESNRFRSNIGLAEVTGQPVTLEIAIVPPDAKFTVVTEVTLAANEFRQINSLLRSVGLADTYNARVSVRAISGAGRVTAYASVIDMLTNDPTYVPAQ
jgi:uncharacterized repeat protein (TIGR01451 family)